MFSQTGSVDKAAEFLRNDPRVAVTIVSVEGAGKGMRPYLSVAGTSRIVEGGAPELLKELNPVLGDPDTKFPPDGAPGRFPQPPQPQTQPLPGQQPANPPN